MSAVGRDELQRGLHCLQLPGCYGGGSYLALPPLGLPPGDGGGPGDASKAQKATEQRCALSGGDFVKFSGMCHNLPRCSLIEICFKYAKVFSKKILLLNLKGKIRKSGL